MSSTTVPLHFCGQWAHSKTGILRNLLEKSSRRGHSEQQTQAERNTRITLAEASGTCDLLALLSGLASVVPKRRCASRRDG